MTNYSNTFRDGERVKIIPPTKDFLYFVRFWDGADLIDSQDVIYNSDQGPASRDVVLADARCFFGDPSYDPETLQTTIDGPFLISSGPDT